MLFVLNSIYESYVVHKNQIIYLAFVNFSKYFDMINRKLLFYKLLKYGITGHVYHVIKSMYDDTRYRVKIRDRYSPSFRGTSGVKQGCSMSPILSNMYQNDLHSIFAEGCDSVQLGETSINSISWADDLLPLSTSKRGLRNCLNDLKSYCYIWGLQVDSSKTKCMILTKQTYRYTIGLDNGLTPSRRQSITRINIINQALGNKFRWNSNQNTTIFIQKLVWKCHVKWWRFVFMASMCQNWTCFTFQLYALIFAC